MLKTIQYIKQCFEILGTPLLIVIILLLKAALTTLTILTSSKTVSLKKTLISTTIIISIGLLILPSLYFYRLVKALPDIQKLNQDIALTSKMYDRNGRLLYSLYADENRTFVPLSQIPPQVIQAHLAIEDANFYKHPGISLPGIIRAGWNNIQIAICEYQQKNNCPHILQGASTITQQVIKNRLLTSDRTWERKIKEAILAIQLERNFSKDQILTLYLNIIPYGGTAYGIESASNQYFNKSVQDLTIGEAAFLAGLPAAPSSYSPYQSDATKAIARQKQILQRMLTLQYISIDEYNTVIQQKLEFSNNHIALLAPHFVMYTKQLLESQHISDLKTGGLNIKTSIDIDLQQFAQDTLNQELNRIRSLHVTNGGVLITKPQTGEILAMVGSKNFFDIPGQGNVNATTVLRQPGSTIKPLTYAAAFSASIPGINMGPTQLFTPASIINDAPITFRIPGSPDYKPKNYDGRFHGPVTLRTALASSYNIPAVKTLSQIGISQLISIGKKLGLTTWDNRDYFGLSLTLGAGEIKMTDMAVAYGTFANLGKRQFLNPILSLQSPQNITENIRQSPFNNPNELDPRVAFLINDILSDSQARSPTFGRISKLNIKDHIVAVKTGTSNDLRDNWAIGYTPEYLVAVWVGNFDNSPMQRIASGITGATPVWNTIMQHLLTQYDPQIKDDKNPPWSPPSGLVQVAICPQNGLLSCSSCPGKKEWFIQGTQPTKHCLDNPTPTPNLE